MTIHHLAYIKNNSEGIGDNQKITVDYLLGRILPNLRNIPVEHLNWVGLVDNEFTEEETPYVLIFTSGEWDSKAIVDKIIEDIVDPYSDDENYPSPFSDLFEEVKCNRTEFINHLKGKRVY